MREAGLDTGPLNSEEQWRDTALRAAVDALPQTDERWDAVIVDEGQDFSESGWVLAQESAGDGMLWAFHDPNQEFWDDRGVPDGIFAAKFKLGAPYRSPPLLQEVADAYLDGSVPEAGCAQRAVDAGELGIVDCPSDSSVPDKVAREIDKLLGDGLEPRDIAIVSLRGMTAKDSLVHLGKLGPHTLVAADDDEATEQIVCDTFLRFKGLERPAIIVTGLQLVEDHKGVRMHIALTRALVTARVVAPKAVLMADSVLAPAQ